MNHPTPFLTLQRDCDEAVAWAIPCLTAAGLRVVRSFDLQVTRAAHPLCPCPYHGTSQCTCQMVILLVYHGEGEPASLIAHGHDGKTWLALADSPQQHPNPLLEKMIQQALRLPLQEEP